MWTACAAWCQTDTRPVEFPFWMVQQIALDLNEKDRLTDINRLQSQEIALLETQISNLSAQLGQKEQQFELQKGIAERWKLRYEMEVAKVPEDNTWSWIWKVIGALGIGYLLGNVL